ncbi:phosphoribosyltransferase [Streptomyces rubellomurinus]|uniref:phosphoribosyltransferase n=1 Tax=Streptomyces rubellomurinus (strain ATCC 31215) TaxID=359131 RepID=UPI00069881DA|nr:phosphoribosyltransferase family protein [Streptomyces rubellomurinus]
MKFPDRITAGRQLAEAVAPFIDGRSDGGVVVLGLAPGGLLVAAALAEELGAPLDATVVRPLNVRGHDQPVGAVADGDPPLFDRDCLKNLDVTPLELGESLKRERAEVHRREALYREGRAPLRVRGRTAVLVSDGLTDALTARTAVRALRGDRPHRLLLAAPVCDARIADELRRDVDALVCLHLPLYAHAAGPWYGEFHDVTDREAALLLRRHGFGPATAVRGRVAADGHTSADRSH